jgi:hypothetical protein
MAGIDAIISKLMNKIALDLVLEDRNLPLVTKSPRLHQGCLIIYLERAPEVPVEKHSQNLGLRGQLALAVRGPRDAMVRQLCGNAC